MEVFAKMLRLRAKELRLSNAEVARRSGLSDRRYSHYVTGARKPDLATLVRIARALGTTTDDLLGIREEQTAPNRRDLLSSRLIAAAKLMPLRALEIVVVQAEAVAFSVHDKK